MSKTELYNSIWIAMEAEYAASIRVTAGDRSADLNVTLVGFTGNALPNPGDKIKVHAPRKLMKHLNKGESVKLELTPYEANDGTFMLRSADGYMLAKPKWK